MNTQNTEHLSNKIDAERREREREDLTTALRLLMKRASLIARDVAHIAEEAHAYAQQPSCQKEAIGTLSTLPEEIERLRTLVLAALEL